MKKFILPVMAAAVLCGCTKENTTGGNPATGEEPATGEDRISITPGIKAITKAPDLGEDGSGTFGNGDVFSLTVSSGEYSRSIDYTMPETALYWEDLNLPAETKNVSFAGCYPKHEGTEFTFNVKTAGTKDLLLAPAVTVENGSTAEINLPFYHAMHSLVIKYKSDIYSEEDFKTMTTTLNAVATCTVDMKAGKTKDSRTLTTEDYNILTGKEISALVIPQEKSKVTLSVKIKGKTLKYNLSDLPSKTGSGHDISRLEGGRRLVVELNIGPDSIYVSGVDIQEWEQQGTVSGEIII